MVKHLEIKNDSGNVIIDENYQVPMLIAKGRFTTNTANRPVTYRPGYTNVYFYPNWTPWSGRNELFRSTNPDDFGDIFKGADTYDEKLRRTNKFNQDLIIAYRVLNGEHAVIPRASLNWDQYSDFGSFSVRADSMSEGAEVEVIVYKMADVPASDIGMVIQNAEGDVLFDIMKPPMMVLDSVYGNLNVWNTEAGRFTINIPDGIAQEHCFITNRSGTPYYSAYKIHSGGVDWGETLFKTVMSFPNPNQILIRVVRNNSVSGSNNAFGYGGFFENVLYCPYPEGLYLNFTTH